MTFPTQECSVGECKLVQPVAPQDKHSVPALEVAGGLCVKASRRKIQGDQKLSVHLTITVHSSGAQRLLITLYYDACLLSCHFFRS